jgi:colanic acid/amylovoran biosynthesis glycosyltransferase
MVKRIAYLVNQYPKVSHSFIRREIHALERRGITIQRVALRGWDADLVDEADLAERQQTRYALRDGPVALLVATMRMALSRPIRFVGAIALAWRMSRRADRPLLVHLAYLAEACRIEPWLRAAEIEHLHAHFGTNSAAVAMLIHELDGPPWSFTVHGPEEFDKAPMIGLAEKIRRSAFVVAVSSYGRSQLYRLVDSKYWSKIQVVHCGLDPAYFASPTPSTPAHPRLICVGRLCEQKGQLILIEAAARLAAHGVSFELVLAGDGEMRHEIEASIAMNKLQSQVRITGWISNDAVKREIAAARALVLPSFAEGLPVVLMEAMALGRPVITTYVAGIPELVRDKEHGWLVPAGDIQALAQAMRDCLEAPVDLLTRMGAAARQQALARHNVDAEAKKLEMLLKLNH